MPQQQKRCYNEKTQGVNFGQVKTNKSHNDEITEINNII